jgi:phenylalanyl-tRNA synthetase beta chain
VASERRRSLHDIRRLLASNDMQEVINFSFAAQQWEDDFAANADPVRLLNPISSEQSVMRSSLLGGLVANVKYNLGRKLDRIRVFEIGRVFIRDAQCRDGDLDVAGVRQPVRVGGLLYGPAIEEQWGAATRAADFFDAKGVIESVIAPKTAQFVAARHPAFHPGRSARVLLGGVAIGWLGELHPRWQLRYELPGSAVAFELDAEPLRDVALPAYQPVSRFPPVIRDMAVVVPESALLDALMQALEEARPALVKDIRLFDIYRGKGIAQGEKSLAFRVVMQDTGKTLTDADADDMMAQLVRALVGRFGAKLRT